jgi:electron transfer flavoprotein beta subunit
MSGGPHIAVLLRRLRSRPDHVNEAEVIGQCERAALTAALKLSAELDAEVTAMAVGTAKREDRVLAMALRSGCNRGVRIYDRKVNELDYLGIASVLAAGLRHIGADLVLCGDRSEDELQGAIGPTVAEKLGVPHLSGLVDVRGDGDAVIARHRGAGRFHTFRCTWPMVLCVHSFPRARHPRDDGRRSGPGSIDHYDLEALSIDIRELSYRSRLVGSSHPRRSGRNATMADGVDQLVSRLREDHVLL